MKTSAFYGLLLLSLQAAAMAEPQAGKTVPANPLISFEGFRQNVAEADQLRATRRLTEDQFLKMMKQSGVVLLDARSAEKFKLRHIEGAVNLSLPDFNAAALAKIIPAKNTPVLIYCNNNFENSPVSFASKSISTALNLHTFTSLLGYGYTQVFELGPLLDVHTTHIPFKGTETEGKDPVCR
ncbi:MAG TPA: rhodanese-like domain-containing protein [Prosthecobacter sp.]